MLIGGGLLLGMGVGFFTEELVAGLFTGLGSGMLAAAMLVAIKGSDNPNTPTSEAADETICD